MLNIPSAPSASPLLQGLPPNRPGPDAARNQAFARELNRVQTPEPPPPAKPVATKAPATGKPAGPPNGTDGRARPPEPAAPGAAAAPAPAPATADDAADAAKAARASADAETVDSSAAAAEAPAATDMASMIAGLLGASRPPVTGGVQAAGGRAAGDGKGVADGGTGGGLSATASAGGTLLPDGSAVVATEAGHGGVADERKSARVRGTPAERAASEVQANVGSGVALPGGAATLPLTAADESPTRAAAEALPAATPTALATLAAGHAATVRHDGGAAGTASFEARLSAALGSPDFAPALGQQITVLVQGGIQQARLHLNPAEMGPITVQIALDGSAAQINLAAEQPLTRQALEQAMPALAGALRDSGLTLTGGGVFEHPRDPGRDAANPWPAARASSGDVDDDGLTAAPATAVTRTLRGAVDLIA